MEKLMHKFNWISCIAVLEFFTEHLVGNGSMEVLQTRIQNPFTIAYWQFIYKAVTSEGE